MITITKIEAENFLSFKEISYDIQQNKATLIRGFNNSDKGQKSNGSGKSSFQSIIELAITGATSRDVSINSLVRWHQEEALTVRCWLYDTRDNKELYIERKIPQKGSSKLELKGFPPFSTVDDGNKKILEYIDISKNDIYNYFILNEINFTSFFKLSDRKAKELISRFTNADSIDTVFPKLETELKESETDLNESQKKVDKITAKIEILESDLQEEEGRDLEEENKDKVQGLEDEIYNLKKELENRKLKKDGYNKTILEQNNFLTELKGKVQDISDIEKKIESVQSIIIQLEEKKTDLNTKISKKNSLITQATKEVNRLESSKAPYNTFLQGVVECPECNHHFNPSKDSNLTIEICNKNINHIDLSTQAMSQGIEKAHTFISEKGKLIMDIDNAISKKKASVIALEGKKRDIEKVDRQIKDIEVYIKGVNNEISLLNKKDEITNKSISEVKEKLTSIQELSNEKEIEKLKLSIEEQKDLLKIAEKGIENIEDKISENKEWDNNFKQFKSYLANKQLKVIESSVNSFLKKIKSDIYITIEGFRINKDGSEREKITPQIYREGSYCDYGSLSKGERVRVDICTMLALQSLINSTSNSGGLGVTFIDEICEGLDSYGLDLLLETLESLEKTIFITTHLDSNLNFKNILDIEKNNGISSIVA